jgi:hypothetical protein
MRGKASAETGKADERSPEGRDGHDASALPTLQARLRQRAGPARKEKEAPVFCDPIHRQFKNAVQDQRFSSARSHRGAACF